MIDHREMWDYGALPACNYTVTHLKTLKIRQGFCVPLNVTIVNSCPLYEVKEKTVDNKVILAISKL